MISVIPQICYNIKKLIGFPQRNIGTLSMLAQSIIPCLSVNRSSTHINGNIKGLFYQDFWVRSLH